MKQSSRTLHFNPKSKTCGPYVVHLFDWAPIIEWYMARLVVTNGHENNAFYYEIGLHAQTMDTILDSIVNITIGRAYVMV